MFNACVQRFDGMDEKILGQGLYGFHILVLDTSMYIGNNAGLTK